MSKPRGRPPKPILEHNLAGSFRRNRHAARAEAEPPATGEISPVPPEWLPDAAKRVWTSTLPYLQAGVVGAGDVNVLAMFCVQMGAVIEGTKAQAMLDAGKPLPFLAKGRDGQPIASPYIGIVRRATAQAASLASELGLSPIARARLGALAFAPDAPPQPAASDPWAGFRVLRGGRDEGKR